MKPTGSHLGQAATGLVVVTFCLAELQDILPRIAVPIVVIGVVVGALRLIFSHTRSW